MAKLEISRCYGAQDGTPKPVVIEWPALVKELQRFRIRAEHDGELWSPAKFRNGARENKDVEHISLFVLDFDKGVTVEELTPFWDELGLEYVIHSTYHNDIAKKKEPACKRWRAVFRFTQPAPPGGWSRRYERLATYLSGSHWCRSCSSSNRLFYLPSAPDERYTFTRHRPGRALDPDEGPALSAESQSAQPSTSSRGVIPAKLISALKHLPADDYEVWLTVGMALHYEYNGKGKEIWRKWSKKSDKYEEEAIDIKWATFKTDVNRPTTLASIYHLAEEAGWEHPRAPKFDDIPPPTDADAPYMGPHAVPDEQEDGKHAPERSKPLGAVPLSGDWRHSLAWTETEDGKRTLARTPGNMALLLAHSDPWKGTLGWCELGYRAKWLRPPPDLDGLERPEGDVQDHHFCYIQQWHRVKSSLSLGIEAIAQAVQTAAHVRSSHPVRTYLDSLKWDGVRRIDTWLETYMGAKPLQVPVGAWWLISAVARAVRPGCQADHVLILEAPQGAGKSTAIRTLAGEWYQGHLGNLSDKDGVQSLLGAWIVEIGELDALRGQAATRVKDFLTQTVDRYRPSYGRLSVDRPRGCVFCGTTNDASYLHDATGGRRFWPVKIRRTDREALERDRDQLWAEAVVDYAAGSRWWPNTEQECQALEAEVEERYARDPWEEVLLPWLVGRLMDVTVTECLEKLELEPSRRTPYDGQRVAQVLRRAGWVRKGGRGPRVWSRGV